MTTLILGIAIFFGVHLVPSLPGARDRLVGKIGEKPFKGVFSLLSLTGLVLIVFGFSGADFIPLWQPFDWGGQTALMVMPVALIFLAAADMPGTIRRTVRHPMSIGIVLWSGAHLLANGDLASSLIFACFGTFAVFSALSMHRRGQSKGDGRAQVKFDVFAVVGGLVVYALILYAHEFLIGVPIIT